MSDDTTATIRGRAPRTTLESDVKTICDSFVVGSFTLPAGKLLTPHTIAGAVMSSRTDDTVVSGGAVAACLARWGEVGYVVLNAKPIAFLDYTDAGRTDGLGALKRAHSGRLSAARAAMKDAAAAANGAPGTGGTAAHNTDAPF